MALSQGQEYNGSLSEDFYNKLIDSENITDKWILANSPLAVVIVITYLATIKCGIKWMEDKPAYDLTLALRLYNLFQILSNLYLIFGYCYNLRDTYTIISNSCSVDISGSENARLRNTFLFYFWGFLVSKITDLLDTIFMVLRKKNSHITFLHVYHHAGMVLFTWITMRFAKAHQGALPGLINLAVHSIMYTYYFFATFGAAQKYLWWKRHLTKLQLAQFSVILVYLSVLYYNDCPVSKVFSFIWIFNVIVVFALFINFYIRTYVITKMKSS